MLTLGPDLWDQNELYEPYVPAPTGEDLTRGPDNWNMGSAYEAYEPPHSWTGQRNMGSAYEAYEPAPSGYDASRFPDRSGGADDLY
eukprot:CAMPEP_0172197270 /NCGR_PEP_ID=MMETSP1050-20130122/27350_1 /TAXON_ID=233186 /ORGANISM="Cryptomonas curvata, Strain CCAP979/52" /LENGTH=85 /DNA_ID=CAMNT_0012873785 /DNA_START=185 /DNA_END=442 /DNA_ORIENTATION=-